MIMTIPAPGSTTTTIIIITSMQALQRLLAWASPAFPVGSFAYSAGLETAIARRYVADRDSTQNWIAGNLKSGAARNDAILAAEAYRHHGNAQNLEGLGDLCLALAPACERHSELQISGRAFLDAARAWPDPVHERLPQQCPYPIAFGAVAGAACIGVQESTVALLTSYVQAQISVAVRLVPIGQADGLTILAALEPALFELAQELAFTSLDGLGSIGFAGDIAAMAHETLETRIFRS